MQFIIAALFAGFAAAVPAADVFERTTTYQPCAGTTGSAYCCSAGVADVANLDCVNRKSYHTSWNVFG